MSQAYSVHGFAGMLGSAAAPASVLVDVQPVRLARRLPWYRDPGRDRRHDRAVHLVDDGPRAARKPATTRLRRRPRLLLSPPILINFVFFLLLAMASFGLQNFLVVGLGALHGTDRSPPMRRCPATC